MKNIFVKFIVSVGSLLPTFIFLASFFLMPILIGGSSSREETFELITQVKLYAFFVFIAVLIYYIYFIVISVNPNLSGKKGLWINTLLLGNIIAVPIFWYLYFLEKKAD